MAQKSKINFQKIPANKELSELPKAEKVNPIVKSLVLKKYDEKSKQSRGRVGRPQMGFVPGQKPKSIKDGRKVK